MLKEGPGELAYFCACPRLCLNLGLRFPRTRGRKWRQLRSLRESYSQQTAPRIRGHPLAWDGLQIRSIQAKPFREHGIHSVWRPPCRAGWYRKWPSRNFTSIIIRCHCWPWGRCPFHYSGYSFIVLGTSHGHWSVLRVTPTTLIEELSISLATRKPRDNTTSPLSRNLMTRILDNDPSLTPSHCPAFVLIHLLFKTSIVCTCFFKCHLKSILGTKQEINKYMKH